MNLLVIVMVVATITTINSIPTFRSSSTCCLAEQLYNKSQMKQLPRAYVPSVIQPTASESESERGMLVVKCKQLLTNCIHSHRASQSTSACSFCIKSR